MQLTTKIKNVLRGVKQRWGNSSAKRALWDQEYAGGRWDHCDHTPGASVYPFVEKYAANGSILDLGRELVLLGANLVDARVELAAPPVRLEQLVELLHGATTRQRGPDRLRIAAVLLQVERCPAPRAPTGDLSRCRPTAALAIR